MNTILYAFILSIHPYSIFGSNTVMEVFHSNLILITQQIVNDTIKSGVLQVSFQMATTFCTT